MKLSKITGPLIGIALGFSAGSAVCGSMILLLIMLTSISLSDLSVLDYAWFMSNLLICLVIIINIVVAKWRKYE